MRARERSEKPRDLGAREHNGETCGRLRANDVVEPGKLATAPRDTETATRFAPSSGWKQRR
jgi:hypothetical protein